MTNLLLLSNSSNAGMGYLDHAWHEVLAALDGIEELVFIPYALADHDGYTAKVRAAFEPHNISVLGVHEQNDPVRTTRTAQAIFVGGGNTFRLLDRVKREGLVVELHRHVSAGKLYMGASAGTNLAGPTIRTTNDMPIIFPEGFDALRLVPFQLNCHYLDHDPASTFAGEPRFLRLQEFHEENDTPVLGLREGAWLRVQGSQMRIGGTAVGGQPHPALVFERGAPSREVMAGTFVM